MTETMPPTSVVRADRSLHRGALYRAPLDLRRTGSLPMNVLVIGSCTSAGAAQHMSDTGWSTEHILFNGVAELPAKTE